MTCTETAFVYAHVCMLLLRYRVASRRIRWVFLNAHGKVDGAERKHDELFNTCYINRVKYYTRLSCLARTVGLTRFPSTFHRQRP